MLERLPEWLRNLYATGAAAWAIVGIVAVGFLALQAVLVVNVVLPPVFVALVTVYLLAPLVDRASRTVPRALALAGIYVAFLAGVAVLGLALVPIVARQITELTTHAPEYAEAVREAAVSTESWLQARGIDYSVEGALEQLGGQAGGAVQQIGRVTRFLSSALSLVLAFIAGPIVAFYILLDLPRLQSSALRLVPEARRQRVLEVLKDVNLTVGRFLRGQILVAAVVGMLSTVALLLLRIPFAVAIGVIAGLSNLVPFIGPIVGGAIAAVVAWASRGLGPAIWVVLAFVVIQQLESQVVSPNIVGRAVRMNPATAMIVILIGAVLAGVWGMLIAIPLVAAGKAVVLRLWFPDLLPVVEDREEAARDAPVAGS